MMHPAFILIPAAALILGPRLWVNHVLRTHNRPDADLSRTAREVARELLDRHGLEDVPVELTDIGDNVEGLRQVAASSEPPGNDSIVPPPDSGESLVESIDPPSSSTDLVYAEVRGGTRLADMKRKLEQECIARALVESGGNITRAAAMLGMKRPRLSQLVKQYKLASVLEDIKS
jgi:DNA-binding NtrC family response regulator